MKNIFVIGAGTMGLDIAQVFASKAYSVTVCDVSDEIITKAREKLVKSLNKRVEKGKMDAAAVDALLACMTFATDYERIREADLVIEAIVENVSVKQQVFSKVCEYASENCVLATNTSSISITEIASKTKDPSRFIGMHFFNPATVMKLVEIIRGVHTSDETFAAVKELAISIGKQPVEVNEAPGFVVNRLLIPMINEAVGLVENGVASVEDIDTSMKLGANHPMGPLALGDLVGLDVCLAIMDTLYNETKDSKYRANTLLRKMVRGGLLGKKSGKGFYDYQ